MAEHSQTTPSHSNQEVDVNHVYLVDCIEVGGSGLDFGLIGGTLGIGENAARMRYHQLRKKIYDATATPAAAIGAKHREVDDDHIYLLECIEVGGSGINFVLVGGKMGISKDAARMRYNRLRQKIYAATTPAAATDATDDYDA